MTGVAAGRKPSSHGRGPLAAQPCDAASAVAIAASASTNRALELTCFDSHLVKTDIPSPASASEGGRPRPLPPVRNPEARFREWLSGGERSSIAPPARRGAWLRLEHANGGSRLHQSGRGGQPLDPPTNSLRQAAARGANRAAGAGLSAFPAFYPASARPY